MSSVADGDAVALIQQALRKDVPQQEPQAAESLPPLQKFQVGSVQECMAGEEFRLCTISGLGTEPDTYDVHMMNVAPAFRHIAAVPQELIRPMLHSPDFPSAARLRDLLASQAPPERKELAERAIGLLARAVQAPVNPVMQDQMEEIARHEATKAAALKARRDLELAKEAERRRKLSPLAEAIAALGGGHGRPRRAARDGGGQSAEEDASSFESLDRNGDGIVTRDEFRAASPSAPAAAAAPAPQRQVAAEHPVPVLAAQLRAWERRARDWDDGCGAEDQPRLLRALDVMGREQAVDTLARLPAKCASANLSDASSGIDYEDLTSCVQKLTGTSYRCSVCPVKFAISVASSCQQRCAPLLRSCQGADTCRGRAAGCLECLRPPALRLLRCLDLPNARGLVRHFSSMRLMERGALEPEGLVRLVGSQAALWKLHTHARTVQRLVEAWDLHPQGLNQMVAPVLEALGVKSEAELREAEAARDAADGAVGGPSGLFSAHDVAMYDADGNGVLEGEELGHALAALDTAAAPGREEGSPAQGGEANINGTAEAELEVKQAAGAEAKQKADEEAEQSRKEAEEEAELQAEAEARQKAEKEEAEAKAKAEEEEARKKAEEEARQRAEEARQKADEEEARQKAEEEARQKAEEEAKKAREAALKAKEDARLAEEEAARKALEADPKRKALEDAWQQALEEDATQAVVEVAAKKSAEEALAEESNARVGEQERAAAALEKPAQPASDATQLKGDETVAEKTEARTAPPLQDVAKTAAVGEAQKTEEETRRKVDEEIKAEAQPEAEANTMQEATTNAKGLTKVKTNEEAKATADEETQHKGEDVKALAEEAKVKDEEEALRKAEEARAKAQQEAKEEAKAKAEEDARRKAEEEAKNRAEKEAQRKAEEESKAKAEQEAKAKAQEEAKAKAQKEAKARADDEARRKAEEEAKAKAEQEATAKAQEEAMARADQEARREAEEEAKAKGKAEEDKRKADKEAQQRAEEEEALKAAEAKREAEEEAEADARAVAEAEVKQTGEATPGEADMSEEDVS